jgi:hypothetical protein
LIDQIKKIVLSVAPKKDARMTIQPVDFITCLIFGFMGDAKAFSIESIRRLLMSETGSKISRSAHWERLASRVVSKSLSKTLSQVMMLMADRSGLTPELRNALGVSGISIFDSSIVTLPKSASADFDGTSTDAGLKFHFEMDAASGAVNWSLLSAASVHDSCGFADIQGLSGRLSLFDLGYFDWGRFVKIKDSDGFFLSRVKSGSALPIVQVVQGIKKRHIGEKLKNISFKKRHGKIIEFITEKTINGVKHTFRVIGFWNKQQKRYHWYITNLAAKASLIAILYRYRWQIELWIKGSKQSLNMDQIPSGNRQIVLNLAISSMIALAISMVIRKIAFINSEESDRHSLSLLRSMKLFNLLARDFLIFIRGTGSGRNLKMKISNIIDELFDPNRNKRSTTLGQIHEELARA